MSEWMPIAHNINAAHIMFVYSHQTLRQAPTLKLIFNYEKIPIIN